MTRVAWVNWLALLIPAGLMAGALGSQYIGHLYPCEMCWWQRWPHYAAIGLAAVALMMPFGVGRQLLIASAAGGILTSGLIGVYHAGVEYHWWVGITRCSAIASGHSMADILAAPLIRCDEPQWTMFGISLAGFNALISLTSASLIFAGLRKAAS